MARLVQISGDGWAADKLVGGLGRTPISRQKRLMGKTVKTYHGRQYKKRALTMHSKGKRRENEKEQKKVEEKHMR